MTVRDWFGKALRMGFTIEESSPERYSVLRRNITILMMLVAVVPLLFMVLINYHQYQSTLKEEILHPLKGMVDKTKQSFELFLAERLSAVSFIASGYSYDQLADEDTLNRVFGMAEKAFGGFVDLGLIDASGLQVSYAGPYDLKRKVYSDQNWFHEVQVRGTYVSDVFMGYRRFPHIIIAVQHRMENGRTWIVRATVDTEKFNDLFASMRLDAKADAFLLNKEGVIQTPSKFYGHVLDQFPFPLPAVSYEANVVVEKDPRGHELMFAYAYFSHYPYILAVVRQQDELLGGWYALKTELIALFLSSVLAIFLVVFKSVGFLVARMRESDEKRAVAFREMEHSNKLSSIGRLAAGVAHEINNPMAIINEKAGLMKDLIEYGQDFSEKEKFLFLINAVLQAVARCRSITHRLLGFARRMEVQMEVLDLNEVVKETIAFLGKEFSYRNIDLRTSLAPDLPRIGSDRGRLQQVFLNLLNNAIAAVEDGGTIVITSWEKDLDMVAVSVEDNGCGMSEETLNHIFEPFFTTKKERGTGLGLPITYGIVKKLGGDIEVRSKEGKGAAMTVYLPKKPREESGE